MNPPTGLEASTLATFRVTAAPASVQSNLASTAWPNQTGIDSLEASVVTAIVLVRAEIQRIPEVAETIAQILEVSEVYSVTGEFDLVAMVRVRSHEELADVIPGRLNKVPGVSHTETHIAFRTYSRHDLEAAFSLGLGVDA